MLLLYEFTTNAQLKPYKGKV